MKRLLILVLLSPILLSTCKKKSNDNDSPRLTFDVTLISLNSDCSVPLIDFKEEDLPYLHDITGNSPIKRYNAYNLDKHFDKPGQVLTVTIRKVRKSELHPCLAFGPGYPSIAIESAQLKE